MKLEDEAIKMCLIKNVVVFFLRMLLYLLINDP